jgi:hypothetical protein
MKLNMKKYAKSLLPIFVAAIAVIMFAWEITSSATSLRQQVMQNKIAISKERDQRIVSVHGLTNSLANANDIINSQKIKIETLYRRTDDNKSYIDSQSSVLRNDVQRNSNEIVAIKNTMSGFATSDALGRFGDIVHQDHQDTNKTIFKQNQALWKAILGIKK